MCGIAGFFTQNFNQDLNDRLAAALLTLRFRGPNDSGQEQHAMGAGVVGLGHTRLSIIDLSAAGHQPMYSSDQRFGLIFNGEIYNYRELKQELLALGHVFNSDSDTEVLLAAWQAWGRACLPRLVGMFAFVVYDKVSLSLTCVRDAFGIKPFFYTEDNGNFLFASEIPAIKALKKEAVSLNWQRTYDYLANADYDSQPSTLVAGVLLLMPGHLMEIDLTTGAVSQPQAWWTPNITERREISFAEAVSQLREKFLTSIKLHLRSDVPLGAALSGGIDSSAVVCAMRYIEPSLPIHTFSYIAKGSAVSEEYWVDLVNQHVNAIPHKVVVSPDELAEDMDDMIAAQGEPFGSTSIYAQYRVFKLARQHGITVTLDGQGADEMLAGYFGYPGKRFKSLLDRHHYLRATRFLRNWSQWPGRSLKTGILLSIGECVTGRSYAFLRWLYGSSKLPAWLNQAELEKAGVSFEHAKPVSQPAHRGRRLIAELALSLTKRGLPALLRHGDRNSMRFSVESRVPFLTLDLAEFLLSLPEEYLISEQGQTKYIFREAMRGIVPDEVLDRKDKVGFETPELSWFQQMQPQVRAWLDDGVDLPFINQQALLQEFEQMMSGEKKFSWQVWRWINFIRWNKSLIQSENLSGPQA